MVWAWIRFDLLGTQHSFPGGGLFRVHFLEFVQVLVTAGKWKCRFFYGQFFSFSFIRKYAIMFEWFQILLHTQNGWLPYLRVGTHLGKDVFFYWRLKWIWVHSVLGLEVLSSDPVFFFCLFYYCLRVWVFVHASFGLCWVWNRLAYIICRYPCVLSWLID